MHCGRLGNPSANNTTAPSAADMLNVERTAISTTSIQTAAKTTPIAESTPILPGNFYSPNSLYSIET